MMARAADISRGDWTSGIKLPKRDAMAWGWGLPACQTEQRTTMISPARAAVGIATDPAANLAAPEGSRR